MSQCHSVVTPSLQQQCYNATPLQRCKLQRHNIVTAPQHCSVIALQRHNTVTSQHHSAIAAAAIATLHQQQCAQQ